MKKKKTKALNKNMTPELPQNIIPIGERVFDDKNIYIHQKVYAQIHKFAANKTENEHGGILVGRILNEMGKENTIIEGFIEAKYNTATPTTLTFTHETWEYFHAEIDKRYKGKKIVGWIHTHPNFGIFLSENDKFIQENFFTDVNQVAYVVDPIQTDEGFFFWVDNKLERCPGFYLFDKNGVKIKQKTWSPETEDSNEVTLLRQGKAHPVIATVLIAVLLLNFFATILQTVQIHMLKKQVEDQDLVIQYGIFGSYGNPPVAYIAEDIRQQLAVQESLRREAIQEAIQQQREQQEEEIEENREDFNEEAEIEDGGNE